MAGNGEIKVHEATYLKVVNVIKWSAIVSFAVVLIVILLISN